jgi:hypothetical protein
MTPRLICLRNKAADPAAQETPSHERMSGPEVFGVEPVTVVNATVLKELIHSASLQSALPSAAPIAPATAPAPNRSQRASASTGRAATASAIAAAPHSSGGCDVDMDSLEGVDFGYYDSIAPPSSPSIPRY